MKRLLMAACIGTLAACGADTDEYDVAKTYNQEWEQLKASLVYSYPANQQEQVPTPSPIVLQFSSDVTDSVVDIETGLVVREVGGAALPVTVSFANDQTVIVEVDGGFKGLTEYEVDVPAVGLEVGTSAARTLGFKTKGLPEGPGSQVAGDTFEVVRTIPDGNNYPVVDFATFRVQFSAPIDAATVSYGDTVSLTGPSGLVAAHVIVRDHYLTVDPKDDLTPGANYTLTVSETVKSKAGATLGASEALSLALVPQDTGPRETLINDVAGNGMNSPLTGRDINMIPMASVLLGEDTATQSSGVFATELAFAPNFPVVTPIRIPRGTLLEAAEIDVLIGGMIDAGFDSGAVGVTFISDATGYMVPNPYSESDDAPRNIHIFMDVGVATGDAQANGSINQNLLHIELVGTAIVKDGSLTINAVGMAEPEVMGSERAEGLLSFYMKAFDDQINAPDPADDTTPPQLVSWTPGADPDDSFNVDDSILFVFDEPVSIDPSDVVLTENGTEVDATVSVDGTTLVIKPAQALKHSRESSTTQGDITQYVYEVAFDDDVSDLSANAATGMSGSYQFELPAIVSRVHARETQADSSGNSTELSNEERDVERRSPVVLALYPGYPCVFGDAFMDIPNGVLGRCQSGLADAYESPTAWGFFGGPVKIASELNVFTGAMPPLVSTVREADDLIYVPELPANRPIVVSFSKNIDMNSVVLGSTFSVEKLNQLNDDMDDESVDGTVSVQGKTVTFWPEQAWEVGATYRYVISSNGDEYDSVADKIVATTAVCDGTQSVCDTEGLPVQTMLRRTRTEASVNPGVMLVEDAVDPEAGGPDMVQYFVGAGETSAVLQLLAAPSLDRNANFHAERNYTDTMGSSTGLNKIDRFDNVYAVDVQEIPDQFVPISGACTGPADDAGCRDPNGVVPSPNTAKILSNGATFPVVFLLEDGNYSFPAGTVGLNIGCGYANAQPPLVPEICPEDKFVYLNSGLVGEVGQYDETEGAVPVIIWPGQIMVTSLPVVVEATTQFQIGVESGPQRIRMRYAQEDPACVAAPGVPCKRNQPIRAWLRDGIDGPVLEATVDAYVDALALEDYMDLKPVLVGTWQHELVSVPVTLELSGPVEFLEDGRMIVNQINTNEVTIKGYGYQFWGAHDYGYLDAVFNLAIPAEGASMQYISAPIK